MAVTVGHVWTAPHAIASLTKVALLGQLSKTGGSSTFAPTPLFVIIGIELGGKPCPAMILVGVLEKVRSD
jgi:hypothetical protein